jgi:endonuclease/exonuclease/phosphatase family metal-dependent hydrolase
LLVAREVEDRLTERPGHVILAGDLDAEDEADSLRFLTGLHPVDGTSVCYRDAWSAADRHAATETYGPENPYRMDWDWPYRRIDHILVRCGERGGPTLRITGCRRTFDRPGSVASDHYGVLADLSTPGRRTGTV